MVDGHLQYLVKYHNVFRNGNDFGIYTSSQAKFFWPKWLAHFLEGHIVWAIPQRTAVQPYTGSLNQTANPTGEPLRISCMYSLLQPILYRFVASLIMY